MDPMLKEIVEAAQQLLNAKLSKLAKEHPIDACIFMEAMMKDLDKLARP